MGESKGIEGLGLRRDKGVEETEYRADTLGSGGTRTKGDTAREGSPEWEAKLEERS